MGDAPNVLIIASDHEFGELLGHHLTSRWPSARIRYQQRLDSGPLPAEISGHRYDVILVCDDQRGLETVRSLAAQADAPPIIYLGRGGEQQIVSVVKAGAADFVGSARVDHERLIDAIENAALERSARRNTHRGFSPDDSMGGRGLGSLRAYLYEKTLSSGEVASVYLTRERSNERHVALKVLHRIADDDAGDQALTRFLREFQVIADIDHPGIVEIFDLGVADDHAYMAMEFCAHGSLKRRISQGCEPSAAFRLIRQVADAVGALHDAGICHRDLKPTNVMFRERDRPVLIDFGLARDLHLAALVTGRGEIFGTPYYMSPEQGHGRTADQRSDIYSMGIMFFELLTGQRPFDGDNAMSVIVQHGQSPIPRLPADLAIWQPAIDRMLAKDPADRFQTAAEFLDWKPV